EECSALTRFVVTRGYQGRGVHDLGVGNVHTSFFEDRSQGVTLHAGATSFRRDRTQRPRKAEGDVAPLGRELNVATRECETVYVSHDRTTHDLHVDGEIAHHLANDGELLKVLLAKVGATRPGDREEFRHDTRDAVKVSRSTRAFKDLAEYRQRHRRGGRCRVVGPHGRQRGRGRGPLRAYAGSARDPPRRGTGVG